MTDLNEAKRKVHNKAIVQTFFSRLSAAVLGEQNEQPNGVKNGAQKCRANISEGASLQDVIVSTFSQPAFFKSDFKDFGVGLPPLAHG